MKIRLKICVKRFHKDMCDHIIFESQNLFFYQLPIYTTSVIWRYEDPSIYGQLGIISLWFYLWDSWAIC